MLIMFYITLQRLYLQQSAEGPGIGNFIASCRSEIVFPGLGVDVFTQIISGESQEQAYTRCEPVSGSKEVGISPACSREPLRGICYSCSLPPVP